MAPERQKDLIEIERWFVRRGLPHFIEDYSARRDIFTRALPLLTLVFVFEMLTALNLDWAWWANVLAIAGALGVLIALLALSNLARHRPLLQRPSSVGVPELGLFVLAPPVVPLIFGAKGKLSVATVIGNALFLGVIYIFTSYGVLPTLRWAITKLWHQLGSLSRLLTRALPLLLLFVTFLFINPDTWQVTSDLFGIFFTATLVLFTAIGVLFVVARLPREMESLNRFDSAEQVIDDAGDGPVPASDGVHLQQLSIPLSKRQWGNAGLVVLVGQGIQVLLVGLIVGLFLVILGLLCIRPDTVATWIGHQPHVLLTAPLGHEKLELTEELLRVSGFLAAFSALYFTVVALTDATYREEFFREVVTEVRQALAVRVMYVSSRRGI